MAAVTVRIEGLSKRYKNGTLALSGVDLVVERGELLALLGPNGAGKTTLVRQLTTELRPTAGAIEILGIDVLRNPQRAKHLIGVVPQEAELFEHLTVAQHLRTFALFRGMKSAEATEVVQRTLRELGLETYQDASIRNLSGGLKRRVLVGLALLADPPLLILDEPTAGLDPESRRALWEVLFSRKQAGTTIILTTHYLEEAEHLADRIGVLCRGKLVALGRLAELRMRAERSFAAEGATGLTEVYFQLVGENSERVS